MPDDFVASIQQSSMSLSGYRDFLISNNVLTTAAGISFGQATLQLIKSFVADMLMPVIYMACLSIKGLASKATSWNGGGGGGGGGGKGRNKNNHKSHHHPPKTGEGDGTAAAAATGFLTTVLVHKELRFANFIAEVITYILILLTAYIFITYVFRRYVAKPAPAPAPAPAAAAKPPGPTDSSSAAVIV